MESYTASHYWPLTRLETGQSLETGEVWAGSWGAWVCSISTLDSWNDNNNKDNNRHENNSNDNKNNDSNDENSNKLLLVDIEHSVNDAIGYAMLC